MKDIPEKDWKMIRKLKDEVLNKLCGRILSKVSETLNGSDQTEHGKYLNVYKIINEEDDSIAAMFNDLKRSNAIIKLSLWKQNDLLTEEQFMLFSEETRERIGRI